MTVRLYKNLLCLSLCLTYAICGTTQTTISNDTIDRPADIAHVAPRFPGCEKAEIPSKYKYLCSQKRFVAFLDKHVEYPKEARNRTVQGKVIVTFIVETDGTISNPKLKRTPDATLGQVCLNAVNLMNPEELIWKPAMLEGTPVRSRVELPIDFRIGYKSIKSKKPITYVNIPNIMSSTPIDADGNSLSGEAEPFDKDKIYDKVEGRPYFQDCKTDKITLIERYKCSKSAYDTYIKDHIQYPESALRKRAQGQAKVACVIELDGTISQPRLLRDPGSGLGAEAMRLISAMQDSVGLWSPGEIGGVPVRTRITLPVRFHIAPDKVDPLVIIQDHKKNILHDCIRMADLEMLRSIDKVKIKEIPADKARLAYGEKGRYGVYRVRLPKGKGKVPKMILAKEEVEANEMYFDEMTLVSTDDKNIVVSFDNLRADGEIVVYNLGGRTLAKSKFIKGTSIKEQLDLSDVRTSMMFVSIIQNELVHTSIIEL